MLYKQIKLDPDNNKALVVLGDVLASKNKFDEAKKYLDDALKINRSKRALRYSSIVCRQLGGSSEISFKESIAFAKEAVNIDMKDGYSWCLFNRYTW